MAAGLPTGFAVWILRWTLLFAIWLGLTDSRRWQELGVGAVAAALAVILSTAIVRPGAPRRRGSLSVAAGIGVRRLVRPAWRLVLDCGVVARALERRLREGAPGGGFRAAAYRPDEPRRNAAGRTLTELLGSLPANRYVVGIDDEEGTLLVHELVPSDEPIDPLSAR